MWGMLVMSKCGMMLALPCLADNRLEAEAARALAPALQSMPGLISLNIGGEWARGPAVEAIGHRCRECAYVGWACGACL